MAKPCRPTRAAYRRPGQFERQGRRRHGRLAGSRRGDRAAVRRARRGGPRDLRPQRSQWRARRRRDRGDGLPDHFVTADLAKVADCRKVIAEADRRFDRVDVLVNAAGLTDRGNIFDTTEERFNEIFDVNVRAPFFLIQERAKIMRREKIAGSIVNIQSMSAHGGQPFITAYCASKGALATLTRNVAHSLVKFRIRVNGLNIGWMSTPGEDRIMKTYHGAKDGWLDEAVKVAPVRPADRSQRSRARLRLSRLRRVGPDDRRQHRFRPERRRRGDPPLEP